MSDTDVGIDVCGGWGVEDFKSGNIQYPPNNSSTSRESLVSIGAVGALQCRSSKDNIAAGKKTTAEGRGLIPSACKASADTRATCQRVRDSRPSPARKKSKSSKKVVGDRGGTEPVGACPTAPLPSSVQGQQVQPPTRRKPGKTFLITVILPTESVGPKTRQDLFSLVNCLLPLENYCIARETGDAGKSSSVHFHCLFKFIDSYLLEDLHIVLPNAIPYERADIQPCRSERSALKYITKEDNEPFYNYSVTKLSFRYQAIFYLRDMVVFNYSHPFVVAHHNSYKFLRELHSQLVQTNNYTYSYIYPRINFNFAWTNEVYEWYDTFVSTCWYPKKKHLYIYGPSNFGKTSFVQHLLQGLGDLVFMLAPTFDKYNFDTFNKHHRAIYADEFDYTAYNDSYLKILLGGMPVRIDRKYFDGWNHSFTIPIIMTSNNPPPREEWWENRVQTVYADMPLFQHSSLFIKEVPSFNAVLSSDEEDVPSSPLRL